MKSKCTKSSSCLALSCKTTLPRFDSQNFRIRLFLQILLEGLLRVKAETLTRLRTTTIDSALAARTLEK